MADKKITVHMLVKNEDRFVWYSLASVLPYADRVLICDSGSSDETYRILKSFSDPKISLKREKAETAQDVSRLRQSQLEKTGGGFIWLVDGDEVYPGETASEIRKIVKMKGRTTEGIVVGRYDLLGDIYHYQDDSAGFYSLFGKKGHFALRLINTDILSGLHIAGKYPLEGYYDKTDTEITRHPPEKFIFTKGHLFHAMYLKRSSMKDDPVFNRNKYKIEKGLELKRQFIPEIFYKKEKPAMVAEVLGERGMVYEFMAAFLTPLKKIKRKLA
ncbi:MAG: family 2 glycosyl transferase [Candidatus Gottesmanbacteria bacterium GW2011_GWA2_43_14]|uniref:Family 2 glycosyl transferase n=1 Tax=Candidatus Gottesmanbacteria bacterium GW2011_GWA2_43_14 TaxID=1618443 RepID=A0A0G1GIN5_9BACT|nr:MAG: family 2 glycosyl transferase [Candidatus Gottesmanbacteria bacterium GW2011_GWA2_43_14]